MDVITMSEGFYLCEHFSNIARILERSKIEYKIR